MQDYYVTIKPSDRRLNVAEGKTLLDALSENGIIVKSPCGGRGFCGKCKVTAEGKLSPATVYEKSLPETRPFERLACQCLINGDVTVYIDEKLNRKVYPDINFKSDEFYSFAVDLGTTTIQIAITGGGNNPLIIDNSLNPQHRYGSDVISRIAAASSPEKREEIGNLIQVHISSAIIAAVEFYRLNPDQLQEVIVSGNTTMAHLLLKLPANTLGRSPYTTAVENSYERSSSELKMENFKNCRVKVVPWFSAFLGGDFLAGYHLTRKKYKMQNMFFIDLGTNGEMFVADSNGKIMAAACAMGPALEGMNISCGMIADDGAIRHVSFIDGEMKYEVIGDTVPVGLCGTALIDTAAMMLENGWLEKSGRLVKSEVLLQSGEDVFFLSEKVYVSQKDLRQLQLAKGASLAAAMLLLKKAGIKKEEISIVVLAGSLGDHLDVDSFKRIGFLPEFTNAQYVKEGNTSLDGALSLANNPAEWKLIDKSKLQIEEVHLTEDPLFNDIFIEAVEFQGGCYE